MFRTSYVHHQKDHIVHEALLVNITYLAVKVTDALPIMAPIFKTTLNNTKSRKMQSPILYRIYVANNIY